MSVTCHLGVTFLCTPLHHRTVTLPAVCGADANLPDVPALTAGMTRHQAHFWGTHAHTRSQTHAHTRSHKHMLTHTHTCPHMHTRSHTVSHKHTNTHINTVTHTRSYTHIHSHVLTHKHVHTVTCPHILRQTDSCATSTDTENVCVHI